MIIGFYIASQICQTSYLFEASKQVLLVFNKPSEIASILKCVFVNYVLRVGHFIMKITTMTLLILNIPPLDINGMFLKEHLLFVTAQFKK